MKEGCHNVSLFARGARLRALRQDGVRLAEGTRAPRGRPPALPEEPDGRAQRTQRPLARHGGRTRAADRTASRAAAADLMTVSVAMTRAAFGADAASSPLAATSFTWLGTTGRPLLCGAGTGDSASRPHILQACVVMLLRAATGAPERSAENEGFHRWWARPCRVPPC